LVQVLLLVLLPSPQRKKKSFKVEALSLLKFINCHLGTNLWSCLLLKPNVLLPYFLISLTIKMGGLILSCTILKCSLYHSLILQYDMWCTHPSYENSYPTQNNIIRCLFHLLLGKYISFIMWKLNVSCYIDKEIYVPYNRL
jgi:hypothetical protein